MKRQLRVIKADGTSEAYLHTKVIGAINNALAGMGQPDMTVAEHLAEVVTFCLYHESDRRKVSSNEIFSMIKAALAATGYEDAAVALSEHAFERRLKRGRTEVLGVEVQDYTDVERLYQANSPPPRAPWDKNRIVRDLTTKSNLPRHTARAVAGIVEERIFNMGVTAVPLSLIKQLVLGEAATTLRAERELQTV
jgi:transcriptional regulator NrdR family protein